MHEIQASWNTLLDQAKGTGDDYFHAAKRTLQASGMEHTAADVIALAQIMAQDFHSSAMGVAAQKIAYSIEQFAQVVEMIGDNHA